jgi:hypothetical protein
VYGLLVQVLSVSRPDSVPVRTELNKRWFNCAGVGAVYYAQVGLRRVPEDRTAVRELIVPVVSLHSEA